MFGAAAAIAAADVGGHPTIEAMASNFPPIADSTEISGAALVKLKDVVQGIPIIATPAAEIFGAVGFG